ncbi:hypothetical protein Gpo141_00008010 [Globisporangium polare]
MHSHNNSQPLVLRRPPPPAAVVAAPPLSSAQPPPSVVRPTVAAAKAAPVVLLPSKDGLPLLPSHAQSCGVDPPRALRPFEYGYPQQQWATGVVDVFGDVSTREAIRAKLLRFYEETKQVATARTSEEGEDDKKKSASTVAAETPVNGGVSEMTLRIDTELELLRQQCFAERNAQWDYHTPDMFTYEPVREPVWNPLIVGNTKIALRRLKHDARATTTERDEKEGTAAIANGVSSLSTSALMKKDGKGFPLGQFSRDRPWPPREFMQKATTRPSRARGGKRKAPAPVIEERSIFSKLCVECHTQSTPLWRRIARESTSLKDVSTTNDAPAVKSEKAVSVPTPVTNGALANGSASMATETQEGQPQDQQPPAAVAIENAVDVCLECYLKLQRSDIFARKAAERAQQQREKQERAAAEALTEKKRLKQQLQLLKKQQQAQAKNSKKRKPSAQYPQHEPVVGMEQQPVAPIEAPATIDTDTSPPTAAAPSIKIVIKTDVGLENTEGHDERLDHVSRPKSAKRDKKKSKKDKKKKKKKKKQHNSDNEDDDLDESDSGTPLPSPPQMVGQYEYADLSGGNGGKGSMRSSRSASSVTSFDVVVENHSVVYEDEPVQVRQTTATITDTQGHQELAVAEETVTSSSSSKRTRKSTSRTETSTTTVTTTTTATIAAVTPSSSSKSRKRKNSVVVAAPTSIPETATEAPPPSSRPSRSKAPSAVVASAPTHAPVVAVVSPAPPVSARKRARTKKESARERELRALGQYCPVCNAVYEEDDESSFVCCDSCEMWVHAACDTTLTPALLAALADTNEKYICPLCAGR